MMKLSKRGLELIKDFEQFRSKPYLDTAGIPTIGYGTTYYSDGKKVTLKDKPTTKRKASWILREQIANHYATAVVRYSQVEMTQNQFDALVSFAYNVGIYALQKSTLLKYHNQKKFKKAANEFLRWDHAGGKRLRGLTIRRASERFLYKLEEC